ncbi:MAG: PrsW family intramembrane metalloprotease [Eubacterium sp.]|nr:PrsW family intramembrane metalloprotease [Eubacterium sp.]
MFYYLLTPIFTYNFILILAAIVPAVFLMFKVYKSDRLEKESPHMLWTLVKAGILSSLLALVEEKILSVILDSLLDANTLAYNIILYFVIVAGAEESSKLIFLKRNTWRSDEFNCRYDGVVYATLVSLGFALWENISYVLTYGIATAVVRAVTAIPGHACFGVFMGVFYGIAKKYDKSGNKAASKFFRLL